MSKDSLSLNNVRVHLSEMPEFFSKKLKSFISKQPDFNEAVSERIGANDKKLEIISQKMEQLQNQLSAIQKGG